MGHAAIALQRPGVETEVRGAFKLKRMTDTDFENRTVVISDVQVTDTSFPGLDDASVVATEAMVRRLFSSDSVDMALGCLLANLDREQAKFRTVEAAVKPPKRLTSERNALLVLINGEPLREPVGDTALMAVINSPFHGSSTPAGVPTPFTKRPNPWSDVRRRQSARQRAGLRAKSDNGPRPGQLTPA